VLPRRQPTSRLTPDGAMLALLTVAIGAAASLSGSNLAHLLLAALCAGWIVDALLGSWNLRHLEVRRELPADLFADRPAPGKLHIRNRRRWLPSAALTITDPAGGASATIARLPPGAEEAARAAWRFPDRGRVTLGAMRLASRFPLGLWERSRALHLPAEVVVFPRPSPSEPELVGSAAGGRGASTGGVGALGDLVGLREYVPGDPPRRLHWPTSARVGRPMVVQRADEIADQVLVRVRDLDGRAFELELARACGQILRAAHRGDRIALAMPHERFPARSGAAWRRTLLEHLALVAPRGGA
jgi:uncharacterized protein (DUF58 family)